ncbi:nuclear transport factor 2 family protein [Georgenia subflava]|uniref:SnoaL-like domain-containing protein n=1 Tax=Georgenia subflava TaxID=1622177 RepID=A0A6N7EK50_9MICO|nr:nuclear transport factor 2 family protein [Georgenia subflava]MPV38529.1 hypothetical protein [Georgenia subflava]
MLEEQLATWVEGYVRAWNSNDRDEIGMLFSENATYRTEPYAEPATGRQAIVERWLELRDEPGQTTFRWEPLVASGGLAIIQGTTVYHFDPPKTYSNLWVIRLDAEGRCTEFTEWWMEQPAR